MSTDFARRQAAVKCLNLVSSKSQLVELHTHLVGMGNADFWVSKIMEGYIPSIGGDVFYPIEDLLVASGFDGLSVPAADRFQQLEEDFLSSADFEQLVRESTKVIAEQLEIVRSLKDDDEQKGDFYLIEKALKAFKTKAEQNIVKEKINQKSLSVRRKGFKKKWGILNSKLVEHLALEDSVSKAHPGPLRALVRNWFQFLDTSGSKPNQADVLETCK